MESSKQQNLWVNTAINCKRSKVAWQNCDK